MSDDLLVAGAAGFIGSKVCELLLTERRTVVGVDNLNDAYDVRLKQCRLKRLQGFPGFSFHQLDICDSPKVRSVFRDERVGTSPAATPESVMVPLRVLLFPQRTYPSDHAMLETVYARLLPSQGHEVFWIMRRGRGAPDAPIAQWQGSRVHLIPERRSRSRLSGGTELLPRLYAESRGAHACSSAPF